MNLDKVMKRRLATIEHAISDKDCMLYALGIGLGLEPCDPGELQFVYEKDLKVVPSMSVVIAHPGPWVMEPELEINWQKLLHGEQSFIAHRPLKPGSTYVGSYEVLGVVDKGPEKGALLYQQKTLTDKDSGEKVATVNSTYFLRADGGCGSTGYEPPPQAPAPQGEPDQSVNIPIPPQLALIYRLSGDRNPLHADPEAANKAGFDRPILHGLCSMGIATRALVDRSCAGDPRRLESVGLRFSAPVYPGETLQVALWHQSEREVLFEARVVERDIPVLKQGVAHIR